MSRVLSTIRSAQRIMPWQLECCQTLEEQHICAWSESSTQRDHFVHDLQSILTRIEGAEVCRINGDSTTDLGGLVRQLEQDLHVGRILETIEGPLGIVDALRRRPTREGVAVRRRYLLWTEAHVLLRQAPHLFGRVLDAIMGVAGEGEFVDDDVLLLQRLILVGRPALDMYAEDPRGQLCRWHADANEEPLWQVITGLAQPPVARWRISCGEAVATNVA